MLLPPFIEEEMEVRRDPSGLPRVRGRFFCPQITGHLVPGH